MAVAGGNAGRGSTKGHHRPGASPEPARTRQNRPEPSRTGQNQPEPAMWQNAKWQENNFQSPPWGSTLQRALTEELGTSSCSVVIVMSCFNTQNCCPRWNKKKPLLNITLAIGHSMGKRCPAACAQPRASVLRRSGFF